MLLRVALLLISLLLSGLTLFAQESVPDGLTETGYVRLADSYYDEGNFELAVESYTRAIKLDPKNDWYYVLRGDVYITLADYERAIGDFSQALRLNPGEWGCL